MVGRSSVLRWSSVVGLTLALSFAAWHTWSSRGDQALAERYARELESLYGLSAELTAETLKSRSGLVSNYDGLVQTERSLEALYRRLSRLPTFLGQAQRARLGSELSSARETSRATLRLIERFKSENAVLRNSLLFLRTAAGGLDAYSSRSAVERSFRQEAGPLVRDLLLLRLSPDVGALERASRSLALLDRHLRELPVGRRAELELMLNHARAVREHAPGVDLLVRQIVAQPTLERAHTLSTTYAQHQRAALTYDSQRTAVCLIACLLLGALAACTVIARLRRAAVALRSSSDQLTGALAALQAEQAKQRELSELKTRFVAMTSHEFRTPLSTIMSSSEMLNAYAERWTGEKKAQHFARIQTAVVSMTRMLDAILLIGRSDAGKLEFRPGVLHLGRFCAETTETATKALSPGQELAVDAAFDEEVVADEVLLKHVIDNLLNNAIKYSPRNGRIAFGVKRDGEDVVFDVSDQGIGIPPRDRAQLFEVFHRGANVGTVAGSGLGLSIVKRAVDLHGGSVEVESEVGAGTRFVVRLRCPRKAA